jgi:hypothetical protein
VQSYEDDMKWDIEGFAQSYKEIEEKWENEQDYPQELE